VCKFSAFWGLTPCRLT